MLKIHLIPIRSAITGTDPSIRDEISAFLKEIDPMGALDFSEAGKGMPVYFVLSGGSEPYFKDIYEYQKGPFFLLPLGSRNSFAASLEILSFLKRRNQKAILLYDLDKKRIGEELLEYAKAYEALKSCKGMRLGLIGGPSDWLIDSQSDPKKIKEKLGINLIQVPMKELKDFTDRHEILDEKAYQEMRRITRRDEALRGSFYIYSAILEVCRKRKLEGFTLRCFDLLNAYQNTSCLAFGFLNDQGILAGCEGDVPSLLTMALLKKLTGQASFMANPEVIDVEGKKALYAHCTCPFSMLESYRLMTHFESGTGFGIRGKFSLKDVTMVKLDASLDRLLVKKGKIVENQERDDICRSQILVQFEDDIDELLQDPIGNHMLFIYGDHQKELEALRLFL